MNLIEISAVKALEMMDKGELTSEIYVQAFLDRIKKREPLVSMDFYRARISSQASKTSRQKKS